MHLSFSEIEAEVRKAARGAGLAWGQAEEAGKGTRWLAARGIDVLSPLADLLDEHADGRRSVKTDLSGSPWRGLDAPLSPLAAGPVLADHAFLLARGDAIALSALPCPILLAPFVAAAARTVGSPLDLMHPLRRATIWPGGAEEGALEALLSVGLAEGIVCVRSRRSGPANAEPPSTAGVEVDPDVWRRIARLAHRTYVPASALSRERGAGAGAIDND